MLTLDVELEQESCAAIFLYADDIILLAPSVQALQSLVNICNSELSFLDMAINPKKSACMRFGPKYRNSQFSKLVDNMPIPVNPLEAVVQ